MRRLVQVLPCAAVAALVAGCGGTSTVSASESSASSTATSTVTDTVVPPATTTTAVPTSTAPASGPGVCATADLTVTLGTGNGAAGSIIYPLHFTNKGSAACTIAGFPGVSYVAPGNGNQVGKAATRSSAATPTITLSPGAVATAQVKDSNYQNYPASTCAPTAVSGFRVYPPGDTAAAYVPFPAATKACSGATVTELAVQPVAAGNGG